jgi:hypothetical protein
MRDSHDKRNPCKIGQHFPREPGRSLACGNNDNERLHACIHLPLGIVGVIFGIGQHARLGFKHHRDAITDREGKPITPANKFRMISVQIETTLTKGADKKVEQACLHKYIVINRDVTARFLPLTARLAMAKNQTLKSTSLPPRPKAACPPGFHT